MNEQEFAELSAGYALNALTPSDRDAFEAALASHPEWAAIARDDAAAASTLAEGVVPVAPPLAMRGSLLSQIMTLPQDAAAAPDAAPSAAPDEATASAEETDAAAPDAPFVDAPAPSTATIQAISRRNWTRGLFTLAASLVLLVVIGFGAVSLNEWVNRPAGIVALQEIEAAPDAQSATVEVADGGVATAHWSDSLGRAVLVTDGMPAIASGETFELWFVRDDGTPVSAGTFAAATDETTTVLDGAMEAGDTIAVTVEQAGGSPSGEPTTDPILAIPTA